MFQFSLARQYGCFIFYKVAKRKHSWYNIANSVVVVLSNIITLDFLCNVQVFKIAKMNLSQWKLKRDMKLGVTIFGEVMVTLVHVAPQKSDKKRRQDVKLLL